MGSDELFLISITSRNSRKFAGDIQFFVRGYRDKGFGGNLGECRFRVMKQRCRHCVSMVLTNS